MKTVGENIKQIRKEKNMTQKELGAKIGGISQQQIGQWETGKANPKIETIEKIAYALDVPITKLVENLTIDQYKMISEYKKVDWNPCSIGACCCVGSGIVRQLHK